jgi:hypothetical protein
MLAPDLVATIEPVDFNSVRDAEKTGCLERDIAPSGDVKQ